MKAVALLAGLAACLLSTVASANPLDTYGFGSRAVAMGSAVVADAHDFAAVYFNPSGLVQAKGPDFSVGYSYASHALSMNGEDSRVESARGLDFGFVMPGELGSLPFAFGLALHLPDERISRIRTRRQEQPRWELYDNRSQLLYFGAAVAIRPLPWLDIGAGLTHLAATRGRLDISGKADITHSYDSQLRHEVRADLVTVRYPQAGLRVRVSDDLALGLAYREQARLELELDTRLEGDVDALGLEIPARYTLTSKNVGVFIPRQASLGSSLSLFAKRLRVDAEITWRNWSSYESSVSRSTADLDVKVPEGLPVTIPESPKPTEILPPRFRDRFIPRLGAEYLAGLGPHLEIPFRAGYFFERSPVPPQTGVTNFVDGDRHVFSLGTGFRLIEPLAELPGDLRLDLHAQYAWLPERAHLKESPADFVGDFRAGGQIVALGTTLSLGFP